MTALSVTLAERVSPGFERAHLFLRVGLLVVIGWLGHLSEPLVGLPVAERLLVSQKG